ncbi:MAG: glutaredoxin family protein [Burkholderiales bacterium]|nr:MAG: glutaredoxin family protein [Burkholderiales bacterium]
MKPVIASRKSRSTKPAAPAVLFAGACTLLLAASPAALAQYKYVAPDGTVTYTDRLPPADARGVTTLRQPPPPDPAAQLSYETRMAARKHPVTLYTTNDCLPCQAAREHLTRRGVPFIERMVNTAADMARFRELGFRNSFPALAIGAQKVFGYQSAELDGMLTGVGYPDSAVLPVAMRRTPPQPLAAESVPVPRGTEAAAEASAQGELAAAGSADDGGGAQDAATKAATDARRDRGRTQSAASSAAASTAPLIRF